MPRMQRRFATGDNKGGNDLLKNPYVMYGGGAATLFGLYYFFMKPQQGQGRKWITYSDRDIYLS